MDNLLEALETREPARHASRAERLKREHNRRRRRTVLMVVGGVLAVVIAALGAWALLGGIDKSGLAAKKPVQKPAKAAQRPAKNPAQAPSQPLEDEGKDRQISMRKLINLLFVGVEDAGGKKTARGLLLAKIDFEKGVIKAITIPDKMYVNVPGLGLDEIGASYSVGLNSTRKAVEDLLQVPIENHIVMSYSDFEFMVNENRLHVAFDKAVESGFFEAEKEAYEKELAKIHGANVDIIPLPVKFVSISGEPYYEPNNDEVNRLVFALWGIKRVVKSETTRVIILNGSGVPGVGREISQKLTANGFMVSDIKNASSFNYNKTQIVVYKDEYVEKARTVRDILGVGNVVSHIIAQDIAEIAIIVGKDYKGSN